MVHSWEDRTGRLVYLNQGVLLPAFVLLASLVFLALGVLFLLLLGFLASSTFLIFITTRPASFCALLLLLLCLKPCARRPSVDLCFMLNHILSLLSLHLDLSELPLFSLILYKQ